MNFALKNTQEMHQKGLLFVCDAYVFRGQFGNIMVWYFLNIDICQSNKMAEMTFYDVTFEFLLSHKIFPEFLKVN